MRNALICFASVVAFSACKTTRSEEDYSVSLARNRGQDKVPDLKVTFEDDGSATVTSGAEAPVNVACQTSYRLAFSPQFLATICRNDLYEIVRSEETRLDSDNRFGHLAKPGGAGVFLECQMTKTMNDPMDTFRSKSNYVCTPVQEGMDKKSLAHFDKFVGLYESYKTNKGDVDGSPTYDLAAPTYWLQYPEWDSVKAKIDEYIPDGHYEGIAKSGSDKCTVDKSDGQLKLVGKKTKMVALTKESVTGILERNKMIQNLGGTSRTGNLLGLNFESNGTSPGGTIRIFRAEADGQGVDSGLLHVYIGDFYCRRLLLQK